MLFGNRAVISLESVDSTNNYAANLIKLSPPPEGTVITAQFQTEGRGQRYANWESREGENLLCSFILYPGFLKSDDTFFLSQVVALAIRDLIENHLKTDVFIKWPNDIIVKNKKIAGVLLETAWNEGRLTHAVIGIGINLNQKTFQQNKAISAIAITGKFWDRMQCLEALSAQLEKYYLKLKAGRYIEIGHEYREHLYMLEQKAKYISDETEFFAVCTGVDHNGKLRLTLENGTSKAFDLKEVGLLY
jgi:BirA family biotin operon repressor/biotin-[acetyl-CoA-carboxylase] ligase